MVLEQLLNGVVLGSTYVLIAIGLTLVYGVLSILHFAHGAVYMAGAFVGLICIFYLKLNFLVSIVIAAAVAGLIGVGIERFAYRPLRGTHPITVLISGMGIGVVLENVFRIIFGSQTRPFPQTGLRPWQLNLGGGMTINAYQIYIILCGALLIGLFYLFLRKTRLGIAMEATAQDMETASIMGIDTNKVVMLTFFIGSAFAGVAGVLVGLYFNAVYPTMGTMPGLKAFATVILGGLGSVPGTILGGLVMGIAESFGAGYIQAVVDRHAIAFIILVVILIIRPWGLLGQRVEKV